MADDLRDMLEEISPPEASRASHDVARRLKQALDTQPEGRRIDEVARGLGVHRTHFSRCFTQTYGIAPSLYRARVMTAQATSLALRDGHGLARVAVEAGFADQSHLARTSRRQIGAPLSRVRQLFAHATSVQAIAV